MMKFVPGHSQSSSKARNRAQQRANCKLPIFGFEDQRWGSSIFGVEERRLGGIFDLRGRRSKIEDVRMLLRSSEFEDRRTPSIFDLRGRRSKNPLSSIFDLRSRRSKNPPSSILGPEEWVEDRTQDGRVRFLRR